MRIYFNCYSFKRTTLLQLRPELVTFTFLTCLMPPKPLHLSCTKMLTPSCLVCHVLIPANAGVQMLLEGRAAATLAPGGASAMAAIESIAVKYSGVTRAQAEALDATYPNTSLLE